MKSWEGTEGVVNLISGLGKGKSSSGTGETDWRSISMRDGDSGKDPGSAVGRTRRGTLWVGFGE